MTVVSIKSLLLERIDSKTAETGETPVSLLRAQKRVRVQESKQRLANAIELDG